jgi:hypothetical protein
VSHLRFHRLDHDADRVELRAVVRIEAERSRALSRSLRECFPDLQITCVDADADAVL